MKRLPASKHQNISPSSWSPRSPPSRLDDYRPIALVSVDMKSFEGLVVNHLIRLTGLYSSPQGKQVEDDAVNMELHCILQHLNTPWMYARILFLDFSLVFKSIIPEILHQKLTLLRVSVS